MDNGISQYPQDIAPKYRNRTELSVRVGWLNPAWNEPFDLKAVDVRYTPCRVPDLMILTLDTYSKFFDVNVGTIRESVHISR